jgi:hypothetical protein
MPLHIFLCDVVYLVFCFVYRSRVSFKFEFGSKGLEFIKKSLENAKFFLFSPMVVGLNPVARQAGPATGREGQSLTRRCLAQPKVRVWP